MRGVKKGFRGTKSENVDVGKFFGKKSPYKPEHDDRPKRTPKERNTGTTVAKRLAGKVIG